MPLLSICFVLFTLGCEPSALNDTGVLVIVGELGTAPGSFSYPRAIATAPDGCFFVVDKLGRVQRFSPQGVFETRWDMPESTAGKPVGLSIHPDGRVFVADTHYSRVSVFDRDGNWLGSFGSEGDGDGQFRLPTDVAFDAQGNIYVAEYQGNDRVSKWSPQWEFLEVLADEPINGLRLSRPAGIVIDDDQTLWIADACNHRIIRINLSGEVLMVFGEFGDAPGQLHYPYDIDLDADGNLLICEYGSNRLQWFSPKGESLRIWGHAGRGPGELFAPWGAATTSDGRVYIVDSLNHRVQIVRP